MASLMCMFHDFTYPRNFGWSYFIFSSDCPPQLSFFRVLLGGYRILRDCTLLLGHYF